MSQVSENYPLGSKLSGALASCCWLWLFVGYGPKYGFSVLHITLVEEIGLVEVGVFILRVIRKTFCHLGKELTEH